MHLTHFSIALLLGMAAPMAMATPSPSLHQPATCSAAKKLPAKAPAPLPPVFPVTARRGMASPTFRILPDKARNI